jgi:endonuclease/exonuclease/phosphatase family metal-dependent hydrolase
MYYVIYPLVRYAKDDFGIALLSRYPLTLVRAANLPTLPDRKGLERRGAVWGDVRIGSATLHVVTTHLGLNERERRAQAQALAGADWLGAPEMKGPFVICGDFNSRPSQGAYKRLLDVANDAVGLLMGSGAPKTWPSVWPVFRIDHVFIPKTGARAERVTVERTPLARESSDHLPVVADLLFDRSS